MKTGMKITWIVAAFLVLLLTACSEEPEREDQAADKGPLNPTGQESLRQDVPVVTAVDSARVEQSAAISQQASAITAVPEVTGLRFDLVSENGVFFLEATSRVIDDTEQIARLEHRWTVNGDVSLESTSKQLPATAFRKGDRVKVFVLPVDDFGNEGRGFDSREILIPNSPPFFTSQPATSFKASEYAYQVETVDPDGDELIFSLEEAPAGAVIDPTDGLVTWPLAGIPPGEYDIAIQVKDPDNSKSVQRFTLTLAEPEPAITDSN